MVRFGSASANFANLREQENLSIQGTQAGCIGGNERYTVTLTIKSGLCPDFVRYAERYTSVTECYKKRAEVDPNHQQTHSGEWHLPPLPSRAVRGWICFSPRLRPQVPRPDLLGNSARLSRPKSRPNPSRKASHWHVRVKRKVGVGAYPPCTGLTGLTNTDLPRDFACWRVNKRVNKPSTEGLTELRPQMDTVRQR